MADFIDYSSNLQTATILIAICVSGITTLVLAKPIMQKMRERGITGVDWNKRDRTEIPELGGIALLFGFPIGISIATGVLKLFDTLIATPILAAIGVVFIAGMIGMLDDISDIPQRIKAIVVSFAALPLILSGSGNQIIDIPFFSPLDFSINHGMSLIFWLIIVPLGITGAANAMNMSAGYNGLETGQVAIISLALMSACILAPGGNIESIMIFAAIAGAAIGLNYYNGYPAITFIGDVGTLSMGAVIGAGTIIGGIEFAGLIAFLPAFYEVFSTAYYSFIKKVNRKEACARPIIDDQNRLHCPKGAEKYTLAYWILSKKPMTERNLVRTILSIYLVFGVLAVIISIV